jgi:DMSO/TMAO reductase YedYZ molybdopterin-dependent catalytic subunit
MKHDIIISPDTQRDQRLPPGQFETKDWPVLHEGSVPLIDTSRWSFFIKGLVEKERLLNFADFNALPRIKVFSDIHCVTTWSKLNNLWEGVSTATIKDLVKILPEARFVMIYSKTNFTTNLPIEDFFAPDVLFALKHNDLPLPAEHGAPLRLIVPRLYFWKSAKWVSGIEFMAQDKPGFWEARGYHLHGDPWKEERYRGDNGS